MAYEAVVAAVKPPPWSQWSKGRHGAAVKPTPPPPSLSLFAKQGPKCCTSHRPENSCFIDANDLVCAGCSNHGHAHCAHPLVMVQSVAVMGVTPLAMPSLNPRYTYLEDLSSDDDFFDGLKVHPKVIPCLKI